jgi:putative nucleotidyltransferase with HDIG domain
METKLKNPKWSYFFKGLLFVAAIIIIVQLFPREEKFKFYYQNGKPWKHELLMAPFDFPIYKDDAHLKREQDSVLRKTLYYYDIQPNVAKNKLAEFNNNFPEKMYSSVPSSAYKKYIREKLAYVYDTGILSSEEFDKLAKNNKKQIKIMNNSIVNTKDITDLFNTRSAYNYIMDNAPVNLNHQILKSYNINYYLEDNLVYNKAMTDVAIKEDLKNVSNSLGIVQSGEKIVNTGEIVNDRIFQILNSLKIETESKISSGKQYTLSLIGQILLISCLMTLMFLYLVLFRPYTFAHIRWVLFILMMIVLIILLTALTLRYTSLSIYIVPFALLPIIIRTFFDSRTALFVHLITVLLASFMVASPFEFVLLQIMVGMVVISSLKDLTQRSQLVSVAGLIVLTYSLIFLSYSLINDGDFKSIKWITFAYFFINGLLLLFAYGLIFIFEKIFGFLSNVTLVELSNVNSPLMMKFSETAPGTFQHSLQVASLATEAAAKVNANSLLVRVGALYHDIGKMVNPMYFIENQQGRINPLSELDFDDAAQIVINHVAEGVKIAHKNNLPDPVVDFIQTHHAQSKAKYFYNSFKNKYPDKEIDEAKFTYPGPKPSSKETAILMMADAVEAASRSLPEYTEEALDKMVDTIIDGQIAEGSFKDAPITFRHIEEIKKIFKIKLKNIYHSRITYPELNK